ncbi:hypothetical protein BJY24_005512 [Nocardia transvalensis]|uniref:Uncharacterized protein n=1 Tax=Nocardia transvalensis TaxID=37333 RepID=A0A7W9PIN0_9NOCA|nr:hypothetical protein [Nocardia transvalensis]MBB5916600.1 hypothetical protein [Nocardia transvalensis]
MLISSAIRILAGSRQEWVVVTDPVVRYRPARVAGRRYLVTASRPTASNGSGTSTGTGR